MKLIFTTAIAATLGLLNALPTQAAAFSALNENTVKFTPETSEAALKNTDVARITIGDTTIYIGTYQIGSNNQDPIVVSFTNGTRNWIQRYDTSPVDGRGVGLLWDEASQNLYGVFTADGGANGAATFNALTQGGWLAGYGSGGGAKASVLLKLNPDTGTSEAGTFIRARLSNGGTNTVNPTGLDFIDDEVVFWGESFFTPLDVDGQRFSSQNTVSSSPFPYRVTFTPDLTQATSAEAIGWDGVEQFSSLPRDTSNSGSGETGDSTGGETTGSGGNSGSGNNGNGDTGNGNNGNGDNGNGNSGGGIVDDIENGEPVASVTEPGVLIGLLTLLVVGLWRQRSHASSSKVA